MVWLFVWLTFFTVCKFSPRTGSNMKGDRSDIKMIEEKTGSRKWAAKHRWKKRLNISHHFTNGHFWERALPCPALAWPVLQGLALFSPDMQTGFSPGRLNNVGRARLRPQAKPLEPRPCPYYSHSQSNCAQCQQLTHWIHRGQFAQPAGSTPQTSCWPGCSSWQANTHIYTLARKHFIKRLGSSLLRK